MSLLLTRAERAQAIAYRRMVQRARKRAKPRKLGSGNAIQPRPALSQSPKQRHHRGRVIDPLHKAMIAQLFCVATAIRFGILDQRVQVAHLRYSSARHGARNPGLQRKPDDRWCLPLAPHEHRLQHSKGEAVYWAELGIDPHTLASQLWDASPCLQEMKQALVDAIANTISRRTLQMGEDRLDPIREGAR